MGMNQIVGLKLNILVTDTNVKIHVTVSCSQTPQTKQKERKTSNISIDFCFGEKRKTKIIRIRRFIAVLSVYAVYNVIAVYRQSCLQHSYKENTKFYSINTATIRCYFKTI